MSETLQLDVDKLLSDIAGVSRDHRESVSRSIQYSCYTSDEDVCDIRPSPMSLNDEESDDSSSSYMNLEELHRRRMGTRSTKRVSNSIKTKMSMFEINNVANSNNNNSDVRKRSGSNRESLAEKRRNLQLRWQNVLQKKNKNCVSLQKDYSLKYHEKSAKNKGRKIERNRKENAKDFAAELKRQKALELNEEKSVKSPANGSNYNALMEVIRKYFCWDDQQIISEKYVILYLRQTIGIKFDEYIDDESESEVIRSVLVQVFGNKIVHKYGYFIRCL